MTIADQINAARTALTQATTGAATWAALYASTPSFNNHSATLQAQIVVLRATTTLGNLCDAFDVQPIRNVLIGELSAYVAAVAPVLASASAADIAFEINASISAAALSSGQLAADNARLVTAYAACASALALVATSRASAGLPSPRALGSGSAPTTAGSATSEIAALQAAGVPLIAADAALLASLAALYAPAPPPMV